MSWDSDAVPDHELETLIAAALEQQTTRNVAAMAMTGWDLRDPDLLIAELSFDGAATGLSAAGVRGEGGAPAMSYRAGLVMIDFEQDGQQLTGQVEPVPLSLTIETLEDQRTIIVDEHGRFSVNWFRGPNRLKAVTDEGSVATEWFLLSDG